MEYSGPTAALIRQHSPFWVATAVCGREDTYRGQIQHWHHHWSSFDCGTPWAYQHRVLLHSKLPRLSGCFWSKSRFVPGWAQKLAVDYMWQQFPVAPEMASPWQKTVLYWERDAVYGLSTTVLCQLDWPLPPHLLAAHTGSVCHFHGSLSIDPTEQADLCFSS